MSLERELLEAGATLHPTDDSDNQVVLRDNEDGPLVPLLWRRRRRIEPL